LISRIVGIVVLGLSAAASLYQAGKYANGTKEVREGTNAAIGSLLNAVIAGSVALGLLLNV